jgi:hypothetical protein
MSKLRRTTVFLVLILGSAYSPAALAQHTYYVSKSLGSDSNASTQATSKSTPWAHLPGMPSCASNCAAYSPQPGDSFILYGGDTWTASDLGIWWNWPGSAASCVLPYGSGATSSCIYIGVDKTWYNASKCGSSWCRPIFNSGGADVANSSYFTVGQPGPVKNYIVIDNIEFTGLYNDSGGSGTQAFVDYGGDHVEFMHSYVHGWIIASGASADGIRAFSCQTNNGGSCAMTLFHDNAVDGSDTAGAVNYPASAKSGAMFATYGGSSEQIYNNYYRYVAGALVGSANLVHDNVVEYPVDSFDGNHCNLIFNFGPASGSNILMYNNVIRHSSEAALGCVKFWIDGLGSVGANHTGYVFNNVWYDNDGGNMLNLTDHPAGQYGPRYIFSNTIECGSNANTGGCAAANFCVSNGECFTTHEQDNDWISSNSAIEAVTCESGGTCGSGGTAPPSLVQTVSTASSKGFTSTSTFAFQPTSSSGGTVQTGANLQSYCAAIAAINVGAGTACQNSTTYGVSYNTSSHAVTSPALTTMGRPSSGAWDIGAYQYASAQTVDPQPPTNLQAVVN